MRNEVTKVQLDALLSRALKARRLLKDTKIVRSWQETTGYRLEGLMKAHHITQDTPLKTTLSLKLTSIGKFYAEAAESLITELDNYGLNGKPGFSTREISDKVSMDYTFMPNIDKRDVTIVKASEAELDTIIETLRKRLGETKDYIPPDRGNWTAKNVARLKRELGNYLTKADEYEEDTTLPLSGYFLQYINYVTLICGGKGIDDMSLLGLVRELPTWLNDPKGYEGNTPMIKIIALTRASMKKTSDLGLLGWDTKETDGRDWAYNLETLCKEIEQSDQMSSLMTIRGEWELRYNTNYEERRTIFRMAPKIRRGEIMFDSETSMLNDLVSTVQTCDLYMQTIIPKRCGRGRWKALQQTLNMGSEEFKSLKSNMRKALQDGDKSAGTLAARQLLVDTIIEHTKEQKQEFRRGNEPS